MDGQWLEWMEISGYEMMEIRGHYLGMDEDWCLVVDAL